MSLRLKLLLLGLATLLLPWAGCRYAREMELALREGEQSALLSVAQTIAASLQGRTDLLYRQPLPAPVSGEATAAVDESAVPAQPAAPVPGPYDLRPILLPAQPYIDGYGDDWPRDPAAWRYFGQGKHRLGILSGIFERTLYLLLEVNDEHVVFDAPSGNPLDPTSFGDRVWLAFDAPDGMPHQLFFGTTGPGVVAARRIQIGEYGRQTAVVEPRIGGALRPAAQGYRVELRVPLSMLGEHFGVLIDDRDVRGALPFSYGTLTSDDLRPVGRLIAASPELTSYLARFVQPGLRVAVDAADGAGLARVDALLQIRALGPQSGLLARSYRRFIDRPGSKRIIDASAPVFDRDHRQVIARLQVSQTEDRWLALRDRALTRMLNLTLIISGAAIIGTLIFAARLAVRLSRLRNASESALTREGLVTSFPETSARDELGDMARAFATLLSRVDEYTTYLRTLAGKLAHEIRTPLTIVRSSLENLESETLSASAGAYLERAREGTGRLSAILAAMGAATRVEEAISNAERLRFDLALVVGAAVESYRGAFPERQFRPELPAGPVEMVGAADLIVQMLDKLVENAVDFSPPGALITIRLSAEPNSVLLEVENAGVFLPPESLGRLFESLWQSRTGSDQRPHFGLGLYIVRLIAEFHGGSALASNLESGGPGARFSIRLNRMAPAAVR